MNWADKANDYVCANHALEGTAAIADLSRAYLTGVVEATLHYRKSDRAELARLQAEQLAAVAARATPPPVPDLRPGVGPGTANPFVITGVDTLIERAAAWWGARRRHTLRTLLCQANEVRRDPWKALRP